MHRAVLSCVNRRWRQHCTRLLSLPAQTEISLALNGYSSQQLKVTKSKMGKDPASTLNLTLDESILLLNESARKFNPSLVCEATLYTHKDTRFPASESAAVVTSIKKSGTKEDLKNFRSLLCNDHYSLKFEFDAKTIQAAIEQCMKWETPDEAMQWLMFAQDRLQLVPTNHSFNLLLSASAHSKSWDVLFYLLAEMDRHNLFVSTAMREELIEQASLAPFARWRYSRDSLLKAGAVRETSKTAGPSRSAQSAGQPKLRHHLAPHSLATALWTLARAGEVGAVRELYNMLGAELLQWSESNNFSASAPATTLPLFSGDVLAPLGFVAVELQDGALLQKILSNNFQDSLSAPLPSALSRPCSSAGDLRRWIEDYVTLLLDAQPLKAEAGRQIGVVVSWLLSCNEPELAVQTWNRHVSSLRMHAQMSLDDESDRTRAATDATIAVISRICAQSQSGVLLPATARFLRAVLVPGAPATPTEPAVQAPVPVEVSAASMAMVQDLLDVLARAQDAESAALVLTSALKQGLLVPDDAMTTSLQLLQKQGDHALVLELFDLYLNIADLRSPGGPKGSDQASASSKVKSKAKKTYYSTSTTLAPHMFTVAVNSYAKLSKMEGILHLLNTELPSRGYIPRRGLVAHAIHALLEGGVHEEGVGVYKQAQKLYVDLSKRGARGLRAVAPGYGVAQLPLVDLALRCCARGKMGLDALEIFGALEEAQGKGMVNVKPGQFAPLIESVIEALATVEYVKFVPQFLNSLRGLNVPVVATPEVLALSLAAAVATNDEEVAKEVGRIARAGNGIGEISAQQLNGVLHDTFGLKNDKAARAFLDKCGIVLKD